MGDKEFERPGTPPHPAPGNWPYQAPPPEEPPQAIFPELDDEPPDAVPPPPRRGAKLLVVLVLGAVVGAVLGGVWVAGLKQTSEPPAISITLNSFPRELLGKQRNDIELREAGFGPTVKRLDAEFEEQLASYRFAYGGDGAEFGYGRLLTLTIVNGILPPNLPRDGELDQNGRASRTRRLISLRTSEISCTFEPKPVVEPDSNVAQLGDLDSEGLTDCVLRDMGSNFSLRITQVRAMADGDAFSTSASFRDELQKLHGTLVN
ncbi:MAG: hypothetical protein Q4P15_00020 [Propionibacteriaceae bacterium]|nr:hypothetical protein [Propionibacteriaceae bacterium]